ncbi:hypothetical protein BTO32_14805 [Marinobacter lutaoensis]|uniref:Uncharacterized protein n=1 Tax=Marinobacter lutaoensis TaxID=135739 RepID=A0A1V2DQ19_9GAMM|nr:hypothetical protein [Marinobacter lutaoensis]ONF42481.1 hypothetical protein BTO32_14805 [Marinobacter lutaoensis]
MTNLNKSSGDKRPPITLFNATDRYKFIKNEMAQLGPKIEELKECAHPGVFDIHIQYSMLVTATQGAASKFDSGSVQKLTTKDLAMLENLQILVLDFADIVNEARAELLPE